MSRIVFFMLIFSAIRVVSARDACDNMVSDWRFDLVLKSTKLVQGNGFMGTFELSNVKYGRTLVLPGKEVGKALLMDYPDVSVQFLDPNSKWVSFSQLAGSFITPPDRLRLKPGSRAAITTPLMTPEMANSSGPEFRIMIRLSNPDICVISRPFHAMPAHSPVTGFETNQ